MRRNKCRNFAVSVEFFSNWKIQLKLQNVGICYSFSPQMNDLIDRLQRIIWHKRVYMGPLILTVEGNTAACDVLCSIQCIYVFSYIDRL